MHPISSPGYIRARKYLTVADFFYFKLVHSPWSCALNDKKQDPWDSWWALQYRKPGVDILWNFEKNYPKSWKISRKTLWDRRAWPTLNSPTWSGKRYSDLVLCILGSKGSLTDHHPWIAVHIFTPLGMCTLLRIGSGRVRVVMAVDPCLYVRLHM